MTKHQIFLIGGAEDETATFTEVGANGKCRLVCEYRGKTISSEALDYFEALSNVRLELEQEKLIPFCYGASLNVFPSQMAREMSQGKAAYKMELGRQTSRESMVRIFDQGSDIIPASVKLQKEYFNDWLNSFKG